ncbi:MAG: glycosyltransferase family 4 protein [Candidatus Methanosuratincola petrocarbonis]
MAKISVCQLIGAYNYAGIARVAVELSTKMNKELHVTLVARKIEKRIEEDIDIVELKSRTTAGYWKALDRIVDQFDIVHTHDVYSLPGLLRRTHTAKIVFTDHGIVPLNCSPIKDFHGIVFSHFCRFYARKADLCIGISDYIVNELKNRIGCLNVMEIPNGVAMEKFRPFGESMAHLKLKLGSPMLIKVGLVEKHRAIDYHIASMPPILKKFPNAHLVFIGHGRELDHYRAVVRAMGLSNSVHFLGWVPHHLLPLYYNAADIVLQADYVHGFGLPILEGMACGKPVIARDAYAMREHILKSGAGVLVSGDDVREIAIAVELILNKYDFYAMKAREYVKRFDWNYIADQYRKAYERVLIGR